MTLCREAAAGLAAKVLAVAAALPQPAVALVVSGPWPRPPLQRLAMTRRPLLQSGLAAAAPALAGAGPAPAGGVAALATAAPLQRLQLQRCRRGRC
jgi:hypothetical protein